MKKNKISLALHMQMNNDVYFPSFNGFNLQRMTNLNIIYIRQIKADDK
jgi:hypothetical protein